PDPAQHADLVGPAERVVEEIARDDLEDEAQEHRQQQNRRHVLGAPPQPARVSDEPLPVHYDPHARNRPSPGLMMAGIRCRLWPYLTALMRSIAPFGHSLAYLSRYFF